jgi:flagellar protein FliO/FliZ
MPVNSSAMAAAPAESLLHTAGSLLAVLAVIFALAWLARRVQALRPSGAGALRIEGGVQVGSREKVLLLRAGDKHLLIGVAPGRVQTLHVFDTAPQTAAAETSAPTPASPAFGDLLRRALGKEAA